MLNLGTVKPGSTVRIPFSTFDKDDGSAITMTNFAAADILVYKDGSTTERASTAGFTATTDFDSKTGKHVAILDLADNTTANFWGAGSEYLVAIDAVTVDAVTTGGWIARFVIGYPDANLDTTIATLASQTSFTLTTGPAEDDALNGHWAIIHDLASAVQRATVRVLDYTGSTKTVTLAAGATFTVAAGDNFSLMDLAPLQPATTGRTLVVDANGLADANTVKIGPTGSGTAQTARDIGTSVLLSSGTGTGQVTLTSGRVNADLTHISAAAVSTSTAQLGVNVVNFGGSAGTFASGRPEVNTSHAAGIAWNSGAIGASTLASDTITDAKVASDVTIASVTGAVGSVTGAVGSVTGAVGSVTGNVGGNVTGSVGSVASGGISEASFATTAGSFTPLGIIDQGTAQSATGTTIVLRSAAAFANDELIGAQILITGGSTGVGQTRTITGYVLSTDTATVDTWTTTPSGTITYKIFASSPALASFEAAIADAVWDEAISGHAVSGSTGEALSAAGAAGDPWITALPGSYSSGQAGYILGTNLNATVSSRASQTSLDTVDDFLDTEIAAILADTNELQTDWANGGRLDLILDARASQTSVDDLPTNAELATSQAAADDATLAAIAALTIPSAATIADAVWDETLSGHVGSGSTGEALGAAGAAGDPWITALPGSYSSGQAGYIVGTNLNATVSSRASQASVDTIDDFLDTEIAAIITTLGTPAGASVSADIAAIEAQTDDIGAAGAGLTALASAANLATLTAYVDTEVAAIKAKTDNLPSDPADASDVAASIAALDTKIDTIDNFLDTEIAAIKAKTDSLTFTVAGNVDANIQYVNDTAVTGDGSPGTEWGP